MRRVLWILAWIGVALWSLFAWGAYGLLDFFGGIAAGNADAVTGHPETVEWLSWGITTLRSLGLVAIVVVWAVVSLLILAVPAVLSLFLGRSRHDRHPIDGPHYTQGQGGFTPRPREPVRRIDRR